MVLKTHQVKLGTVSLGVHQFLFINVLVVLIGASDRGSKGFWKAIKQVTNENEPKQKQAEYPKLFYKDCVAVTDKEKGEMFKRLLNDTMENHETDSSITSELCDNIENQSEIKHNSRL